MEPKPTRESHAMDQFECLRSFMAPRYFVADRVELSEQGFTSGRIDNWCRGGRLVQVAHGVYSLGRDIDTREAALRVALLLAGPGSALTARSACEEWRAVERSLAIPSRIEVATASGKATTHQGRSPALRNTRIKVVHRSLEPGDFLRLNKLEVVRPVLAIVDFAVDAGERDVRFAFLEACRLKLMTRGTVNECYRRIYGRRGARKLRPLLGLWVPELGRIKSVFEGLVLLDWIELKYSMPLINCKVLGWEVDLYWPQQRYILELDGGAFHSDPVQRTIDRQKQMFLESRGLTVNRLTYAAFDADPVGELRKIAWDLGFLQGV